MKQTNIWIAVGLLQLIYGVILLVTGVRQFWHPPPTVLANLHATFWAGFVLTLAGLVFTLLNSSLRNRRRAGR